MASGAVMFAGKAIATSVISYIVNKAFDYLKDNKESRGLKSIKERLERVLPQIQVVFDAVDAEQIRDQSKALDTWLWQLRDAVEEAEDALDDLEYYKLEEEVKSQDNKVRGSLHKYKGKVIQQFNHAFNTGSLKRLRSSVMTLDEVASGVERFFQVLNHLDKDKMNQKQDVEFKNWRQTSSLPHGLLIGREEERKIIVDWLTKPESDAVEQIVSNIAVFSIIGIGGVGKTTLAQDICDVKEVKEYFDFLIWVCVSHSFDIETLTKKILEDMTGEGTAIVGLNALHKALKEMLHSKTFLLVLDDVWNDERFHDWENFLRPLRYGKKGSKILLTTRMQSVADVAARTVQGQCQSLRLSGLEEADLLFLLNRHAFFGVDPNKYRNLQQISKKMVSKLSGSPLAAKVLGGLLNSNKDSRTWIKILASGVHNIQEGNEGIMAVLRLSYQHLPTHLQACFRYCSLFHKGYEFSKKELVYLWMGSGLIQQFVDDIMPEDIGMGYLDTLSRKSFFEIKSGPRLCNAIKGNLFDEYYEERFIMHDLLHDLAQSTSVSECTRVDINFSGRIPKTVRHIFIEMISPTVVEQISHANKLRTLLVHFEDQDEAQQGHIISKVLGVAKSLRVLSLTTNSPCKLPDGVGGLMHLRYLSLTCCQKMTTHFCWFPKSVYKLYHLQVLKFDNPQVTVPEKREMEGVCNLVNLRHLQLSVGIIPMIPYVGKLTSLQELHNFCIKQQSGYTIGELKNLKKICHLYVSDLDKVKSAEEAAEVMLDQKENMLALRLGWSASSYSSGEQIQAELVIDKLQPHPNSHKLKIDGYPGSRSPCWLQIPTLINLTYVYICNCGRLQHLPPLGQLASLQYLYIINLASVECVDSSFYGNDKSAGLQSLKVLEIENLPKLVEWVGLDGVNLFPRLETLIVRNCEVLRSLPSIPINTPYVEIHRAGRWAMPTFVTSCETSSSSSLDLDHSRHMLYRCQNIKTLWRGCSLSAVEEWSTQQRASLSCLPENSFGSLSSVKTLHIVKPITLGLRGDAGTPLHSMRGLNLLERLFLDGSVLPYLSSEVFACLAGLTDIMIGDCAITSLPSAEAFARLTNLRNLWIWDCRELVSIDGIQGITSLVSLQMSGCSKITADSYVEMVDECANLSSLALQLDELDIDNPSLLLREPLRSISSVKKLRIVGGPELSHLPEEWLLQNEALKELEVSDASHLICLGPQVTSMSSIESFHISNAKLIQSLPDMPISLRSLRINDCHPELKKRCQKINGLDWVKIAHICDVNIS